MLRFSAATLIARIVQQRPIQGLQAALYHPLVRSFSGMTEHKATNNRKKDNFHEPCEYEVVNTGDRYIRYVKPYFQDFRTFAKGRWLGRELQEVFATEFGAHPPAYWASALRNGQIRVNAKIMQPGYRIANGDVILHRTHRYGF
jgi:hypothetical protein